MKIITVTTIGLAALFASACTGSNIDCPDPTGLVSHYEVGLTGIESVLAHRRDENPFTVPTSNQISESDLIIRIELSHIEEPRYYSAHTPQSKSVLDWFIKPALACSPIYIEDTFTPQVSSITIHSDNDFNEELIAGTDLSGVFKETRNNFIYDSLGIANISELASARTYKLEPNWLDGDASIQIVPSRTHVFTISVTLDDGRLFEMRTQPVTINRD